jgi:hypothetical protein
MVPAALLVTLFRHEAKAASSRLRCRSARGAVIERAGHLGVEREAVLAHHADARVHFVAKSRSQ